MKQPRSSVKLAEQEDVNLQSGLELLGDTYDLITDLETLYDTLPLLCKLPKDVETNPAAFAAGIYGNLVFLCRRQLTVGTLTLLRGYRGDHKIHLRRAIETCAFAAKMERQPDLAKVWLAAGTDEEAFVRFRDKFCKLFPKDDRQLAELGRHYDVCAKATHPSMYGVALYFAAQRVRKPGTAGLDVFDVVTEGTVVAEFVTLMCVHLLIIQVFDRLLKPYTADRLKPWSAKYSECEKNYLIAHRHWEPFVTEALKRSQGSAA